ncbi:Mucin-associated surface protein (MASP) [Trypanosoma cruzi]|uniref:Mucin-associated surface protein (MASP), putative n=2 Tax=Trypanosoma cruzi TaxID=5693 RepID=Q4E3U0_TRYCC|nr:mucin-associated surface protein (MASP), putative [Trypanosoma cruzi]EAN99461.1 mucin-associated surface protein (MASP), putative [Trypanosoma cruzi]PWV19794.1 Mucin-associated surface protein (MASP) [Trypanosoma cruzi]RNC52875.1 mucin-associated surface protein (MASP) [Trypanosoma cruzi]|eukprot:XP_821312.1 mucin-associated surface protein (MASP) [Trypanosoma cruzi strain CL Brener]
MAMMMVTGRLLLLCALCVLWCGAGGGFANEERAGLGSGGAESLLESQELEKSPQVTQGIRDGTGGVKEQVPSKPPEDEVEEDEDEDDEDEEDDSEENEHEETEDGEKKSIEGQSDQEGTVAPEPGSREKNLIGSGQENHQPIVSAEGISLSGSQESNANPTQPEVDEKKETKKSLPAVENAHTPVNGEHTLLGGVAGGNPPSPPEEGVDSREHDGEDTTSEEKKDVPPPETAATPQSRQDKGSEGNGEDTKATTVTANTTDTKNTQNSDGSTAVSHTTSPLLLLVVACAAAAAVVAA